MNRLIAGWVVWLGALPCIGFVALELSLTVWLMRLVSVPGLWFPLGILLVMACFIAVFFTVLTYDEFVLGRAKVMVGERDV